MNRSRRLRPVVKIARNKEQEAARELGEMHRKLNEDQERLAELRTYHVEYTRRYRDMGGNGTDARRLNHYRGLLARLNEAIDYQQSLIESGYLELEKKNQRWCESRARHKALDKVLDRYHAEDIRAKALREQREIDDRAQRLKKPVRLGTE